MTDDVMKKFDFYANDPGQYAAEWCHEHQRKAVGVFPNYFPVEILDAAGLLPVGLWGSRKTINQADTHLPAFVCSLVKSNFEMALAGNLKSLSGVVFPQICDTLQNSESVWRSLYPDTFTTRYRISKNPQSKAAKDFLVFEIKRIAKELGDHFGVEFGELDLIDAILRRNTLRKNVREFAERFFSSKAMMHPLDFYVAVKASHVYDPDDWMAKSTQLSGIPSGMAFGGSRIFLSGMTPEPLWLMEALDRVDCTIVGDDIAFSTRYYANDVSEKGDPWEALAEHTLSLAPCANLHQGIHDRANHLVEQVKKCDAHGVVFTRLKFCDPEAFDHPHLKKALDEAGIPSLLIETELSATDVGAITTRIEAFAEQLEQGGAS